MKRKSGIIIFLALIALIAVWVVITPAKQFGPSCYALTTFHRVPLPLIDFQIRSDGSFKRVPKTHDLTLENIQWLIDDKPEVLIVSLGWSNVVAPRQEVSRFKGCEIHLIQNGSAIKLFNRFKKAGRRVAIQYHSTC